MKVRKLANVECPECGRVLACSPRYSTFPPHSDGSVVSKCEASGRHVTDRDYFNTTMRQLAAEVLSLAGRMRDQNPAQVWLQLKRLDENTLRHMLFVALAAAPTDELPLSMAYRWVYDLEEPA